MNDGVPCMWMRGGTSKGGYILEGDLPADPAERDRLLLRIMGSPDPLQIDGMGGADPLTSKIAIVSRSARSGVDVDYLFLQVFVDEALVSDAQNCGNILAGVGPFAIERGLVSAVRGETSVTIFMKNSGQTAVASVQTPDGSVSYQGSTAIDGVPGTAAPIRLEFLDTAGSSCGALLPTGNASDDIDGITCTLIDNGMPCIVVRAEDLCVSGYEDRETLDQNEQLKTRIEKIRLAAGPRMNLGDVTKKSVPKIMLVAPPKNGGAITVRSFIPHRAHASVGVFAAVSVATAAVVPGTIAQAIASVPSGRRKTMSIEHPTGEMTCVLETDAAGTVVASGIVRTARKLMDGIAFV